MGRWMSPDWSEKPEAIPYADLSNPQSLNLDGYVNNNPLSRDDADGHDYICLSCLATAAQQFVADHPRTMQVAKGVGQIVAGAVGVGIAATSEVGSAGAATVGAVFAVQGSAATAVIGVTNVVGAATKTDVSAAEKPLPAVSNPAGHVTTAVPGSVKKGAQTAAIGDAVVTGANIKRSLKEVTLLALSKTVQAVQSGKEGVQAVREIQHPNPAPGCVQSGNAAGCARGRSQ
jgi:hypothetical protein